MVAQTAAVGYRGGKRVAEHVVRTPEAPTRLVAVIRDEGVPLCRRDIVFVDVALVDRNGTPVTDNTTHVSLRVAGGDARIVGDTERRLMVGLTTFVLNVGEPKGIVLKAAAEGGWETMLDCAKKG